MTSPNLPGPDYDAAIEFLKSLRGIDHLVAIHPDSGAIEGMTFTKENRAQMPAWIEGRNRTKNVYWSTGVVRRDHNSKKRPKPNDDEIVTARMLKVDLDPLPVPENWDGTDEGWIEKERALILSFLTDDLPDGVPGRPTIVLDSGSGLWGLWVFSMPVENLEPRDKEYIRACGEHLIELYRAKLGKDRADGVADLSRIARLPGTTNWPDEKKRAKGRSITVASVVEDASDRDRTYAPASFLSPEAAKQKTKSGRSGTKAAAAVTVVHDLEQALPSEVPDLCRVVIAQGYDPDDPARFGGNPSDLNLLYASEWTGDRSAAVWYVCCALVRADVEDDTIRALLLDPGWGISAHVLDQKDPEACADRQIENAREAEGRPIARPTIYTNLGEVAEVVDQAQDALVRAGVRIYQRGPELVRLVKHGAVSHASDEDDVRRSADSLVIFPVSALWLVDQMSRAGKWRRKLKEDESPSDPSEKHGRLLLARAGSWPFPPLLGIVTAPTLRADGSILQMPGYDPSSGLIFAPGGTTFPAVPENPTREDAVAALAKFEPLFAEFPFVDTGARAVVLSAILSGLVRSSLQTIPLHAFDAPTAGTGKTMLAETVALIVMGHLPTLMNQGKEEGEDEKRLGAVLRAGDPCLLIDNCDRPVEGDTLCSVLTSSQVSIRILGRSENVTLPCDVLVMATGNNLQIINDMARRTVICRLDAQEERPERRRFDFDPRALAAERRAELVVAALTILRAYAIAEGVEPPSSVGSFEAWNRRVRSALLWCGAGDPVATMEKLVDENQGGSELGSILDMWWRVMGDSEPEVSDLRDAEELAEMLREATGRPLWNSRSVGWYLRRNVGKIVGGLTLRSVSGESARVRKWQVVSTRGEDPGPGERIYDEHTDGVFGGGA